MGSIAKKMRRQLHDAIRKGGAEVVRRASKRPGERSTMDEGPKQYFTARGALLLLSTGHFTLPDGSECWVFAAQKCGLPPTEAERQALDAAAMSAASKTGGECEVGPVQGPRTIRGDGNSVIAYAWRVGGGELVVEPQELNHLARLLWRKLARG